MAPSAILMDVGFKKYLQPNAVPATIEGTPDGRPHIMFNPQTKRSWFCTPGTQEFHNLYKEDPWEFIRYEEQGNIVSIVNNICNLIDRKKWCNKKEG